MSEKNKILSVFKPTIQLDEIAIQDAESPSSKVKLPDDGIKPSKVVGNIAPYVKINGYVFDHNDILDMTLSEKEFLPTLRISIRDTRGIFKSAYFPKTNPMLSLYIRSKHDKLKCIRCDFLITSIYSDSSIDAENHIVGKNMDFTFYGVLLVPGIFSNTPMSFPNMTSYDVIKSLAVETGLGFASNEDNTNDMMTWIKSRIPRRDFIHDVLIHSFSDDQSFYMGFVDKYYHMNFINVAKMFEESGDFDSVFERSLTYADLYEKQSQSALPDDKYELVLTNMSKMGNSDVYIMEHRPVSSSGSRLLKSGHSRSISYYDQMLAEKASDNFVRLEIVPISPTLTPGGKDSANGKKNNSMTDLANNLSYDEWCGIDYNNGHDNYNYAYIQNSHNNNEIRKITMYVKLNGVNLNIIRGMRIPVAIVRENVSENVDFDAYVNDENKANQQNQRADAIHIIKDKWLSGYYVVGDITYTYDMNGFFTELTLLRSNWDEPEATMP